MPLNAAVVATFTRALDCTTLSAASFLLACGAGPVAGTVSCAGSTATFTPAGALAPGTSHAATLTPAVKDSSGAALAGMFSWGFTTGAAPDATPPAVSSVTPAAGALASAAETPAVSASFSEPIDCAGLPADALALYELGVPVPGYLSCSGATLELVPVPALPTQTSLVAVISPLVRDLAGNALGEAHVWSFDVRPWTRQLGTASNDQATSVAIDAAGNVFVAGYTTGGLDGNVSAGSTDLIVVKYGPDGRKR